jgi:hypothetical protein
VKDEIHAGHGLLQAIQLPHVPDMKLEFRITVIMPHVIVLLFVAGKDANLGDASCQEPAQHGVAKTARATGNEKCCILKRVRRCLRNRRALARWLLSSVEASRANTAPAVV